MTQYTPNLTLPYPEASDAPRGNEQIQALAERLDTLSVTGPVYKTAAAWGSAVTTASAQWTLTSGGEVKMRGGYTRTTAWPGNTLVFTIPSALRPPVSLSFAVAASGTSVNPPLVRADITAASGAVVGSGNSYTTMHATNMAWFPADAAAARAYFNTVSLVATDAAEEPAEQ